MTLGGKGESSRPETKTRRRTPALGDEHCETALLLVDTISLTDHPELGALFDGFSVAGQHGTLADQFGRNRYSMPPPAVQPGTVSLAVKKTPGRAEGGAPGSAMSV